MSMIASSISPFASALRFTGLRFDLTEAVAVPFVGSSTPRMRAMLLMYFSESCSRLSESANFAIRAAGAGRRFSVIAPASTKKEYSLAESVYCCFMSADGLWI